MTAARPDDGNSLSGREVVFKLDRGYRAPLLSRGAVLLVVAAIAAFLGGNEVAPLISWVLAVAFGAGGLLLAAAYGWQGRFRTRLSPEGIEARGYVSHFVPWPDVASLEVANGGCTSTLEPRNSLTAPYLTAHGVADLGYDTVAAGSTQLPGGRLRRSEQVESTGGFRARLATVRAVRSHGRRVLLRAPLVTTWQSDPDFEKKVKVIQEWWHAYGQPAQPPG